MFLGYVAGLTVVRPGGFHGQHGDLRSGGGGQAGQRPEHSPEAILQTTLHARLRILYQRPVGHLQ